MFLKSWRLLTIVLTALSLAPALGHALELPAKMRYGAELWLTISKTLYGTYGTVGAAFEIGAVISTIVLAILVRHRRPAFVWTLVGALCVLTAHLAYWIWLAPVNATIAATTLENLPENWMNLRRQWEYTHAIRALLQAVAVGALTFSILEETPGEMRAPRN